MAFLMEADRPNGVGRATRHAEGCRHEKCAEQRRHLCLLPLTLAPHAPADVSIDRAVRMLLVHELVPIDAGEAPFPALA